MRSDGVAQLRRQIELQYAIMRNGLSQAMTSAARHQFVVECNCTLAHLHGQLAAHVGEAQATAIISEINDNVIK